MRALSPKFAARRRTRADFRKGTAIIEFAIVVPFLFLIVFGLIELGRAVQIGQLAINGSREGARKAALTTMTVSEVQSWVKSYLLANGIANSATTVTLTGQATSGGSFATVTDLSTIPAGNGIQVQVAINFSQVSWLAPIFMSSSSTINGSTIIR